MLSDIPGGRVRRFQKAHPATPSHHILATSWNAMWGSGDWDPWGSAVSAVPQPLEDWLNKKEKEPTMEGE